MTGRKRRREGEREGRAVLLLCAALCLTDLFCCTALPPPPPAHTPTQVEVDHKSTGVWYPATVTYLHDDGTVNVEFDDGEGETNVPESRVRVVRAADPMTTELLHLWHEGEGEGGGGQS